MKIVLVQDFLRMGGTERQTVALAHAFAAAGHEATVMTLRPGGPLAKQIDPGVRQVVLQARDFHADWYAPALIRRLKELQPDVVQLMGRMANAHGWRIARALPGVSLVATMRTGKKIPRLCRLTLRRAHAVVANSEHARQRLARECGIAGPTVHLIRNAVVVAKSAQEISRSAARQECDTPADALVLLCAAMMHPGKGHADLIRIAGLLHGDTPWELWLAGDGPLRDSLERQAGQTKMINGRVRFLGVRTDMERLYAAADIAVLASQPVRESLPNFLVEAQWHGVPVIAYDAAGLGETFVPKVSGVLIPLDDKAGFARAIDELATDASRRSTMRHAARTQARREFDPQQQNQRYLDLYTQLRSKRNR